MLTSRRLQVCPSEIFQVLASSSRLQALPAKIRLGWKGLPGTNTLVYFELLKIADGKCFITHGQGQPKIVTKVENEDNLLEVYATALSLGLVASIIQDAGHTQVAPGSKTVVS